MSGCPRLRVGRRGLSGTFALLWAERRELTRWTQLEEYCQGPCGAAQAQACRDWTGRLWVDQAVLPSSNQVRPPSLPDPRTEGWLKTNARSMTKVSLAQAAVEDAAGIPVGPIPGFDFLIDWYTKNAPTTGENGIVHGDFKCDNMVRSSVPLSFSYSKSYRAE